MSMCTGCGVTFDFDHFVNCPEHQHWICPQSTECLSCKASDQVAAELAHGDYPPKLIKAYLRGGVFSQCVAGYQLQYGFSAENVKASLQWLKPNEMNEYYEERGINV